MTLYPFFLCLEVDLLGDSLIQVTREWMENINHQGFPSVISWACPLPSMDDPRTPGNLEQALQYLIAEPDYDNIKDGVRFDLEGGCSACIFFRKINYNNRDAWSCELRMNITDTNSSQIPEFLEAAASLCRHFLSQGQLNWARVYRLGSRGLGCIPYPPLAAGDTHLIVVTSAQIESNYEQTEVFWQAWDNIEQYQDQYLLTRGLSCVDDVSFLAHIMEWQWQLARGAKPGVTKHYRKLNPEEMPVYQTEESYLNLVGYIPSQKVVEYTCWVDPDFHIQGWEIHEVWKLVDVKKLKDGRQVDTVRIVFLNREMAEREKRPLLDIGAQVWYYNPVGETEQIIE